MTKKNRVVVGTQWGDEGKGKIVDILSEETDIVARYGGGPNAGHTTVTPEGIKIITHSLPTGISFKKICVIGNGVVLNPDLFEKELRSHLIPRDTRERIIISNRAHLIIALWYVAWEDYLDRILKIGTTRKCIGQTYAFKDLRIGIEAGMLLYPDVLRRKLEQLHEVLGSMLGRKTMNHLPRVDEVYRRLIAFGKKYQDRIIDTAWFLNQAIDSGKSVLLEGAQGALLDIDLGTYPYCTSSNISNFWSGAGVSPSLIHEVIAVFKAYQTRVGNGPMPTEQTSEVGVKLQTDGKEFGATTGRPRRCGWLDLVLLKYVLKILRPDKLAITKLDVLDGIGSIKVCTGYELDGRLLEPGEIPSVADVLGRVKPVYITLLGWPKGGVAGITKLSQIHPHARYYIDWLQEQLGVPIWIVSTGGKRNETIFIEN